MRFSMISLILAVEAAVAAAQSGRFAPTITSAIMPTASGTGSSANACASLASQTDSLDASVPTQVAKYPFKPSDVYACLKTIPTDKDLGTAQIAWIQSFLQFQSTLAWLKSPPPTYQLPAVDLVGSLNNISKAITAGKYQNEYQLELDIYNVFTSAADGHLNYKPYLVSIPILRNASLVSVSLDGVQVPKVYASTDILKMSNSSFIPSAIVSVNGQDANQYLTQLGLSSGLQDLDAEYNSLFYNPATNVATGGAPASPINAAGGFSVSSSFSANDTTTCKFENGTTFGVNATALLPGSIDLSGTVQDIFQKNIVNNDTDSSSSPSSSSAPSSVSSTLPTPTSSSNSSTVGIGFPVPVVKHSGNLVSGYFLNGTDNSDVAVLSVPTFMPGTDSDGDAPEFQKDVAMFLAKCKSAGKTRLIVDVRGNGGGDIYLGYDLFKQLFPTITPYSGIRIRGSDAVNALGQIGSSTPVQNDNNSALAGQFFDAKTVLQQPDGPNYTSWQKLYPPHQQKGDIFSNIASWTFSNASLDLAVGGIVVSGYANNTNILSQVFSSDNIILLTDGQCSSTCATFSNLMINQGRVRTVTAGGRPNNQPMAVIGGVQGAQVVESAQFSVLATEAIADQASATGNSSTQAAQVLKTLGPLIVDSPLNVAATPGQPSVNAVDNIAQGDKTVTPLQFYGIPANCRFYYMPSDISSVSYTWARVAKGVKAGGSGLCIGGSLSNSTQLANGTIGGAGSNSTSGRNGTITFTGAASIVETQLRWIVFTVVSGAFTSLVL